RRTHAMANNRSLRSLALPSKNSSIVFGSVHANHSASVMTSLLTKHQIDNPAAQDMWPFAPAVVQDVLVVTTGVGQGIGKYRHSVKGTLFVNALSDPGNHSSVPGEPSMVDDDGAEGERAKDVTEESNLNLAFCFPQRFAVRALSNHNGKVL